MQATSTTPNQSDSWNASNQASFDKLLAAVPADLPSQERLLAAGFVLLASKFDELTLWVSLQIGSRGK